MPAGRRRVMRGVLGALGVVLVAATAATAVVTRQRAHELVTNPLATRHMPGKTPADYGLPFEDVVVRTDDGLWLSGWYIAPSNGAVVVLQHGYKSDRGEMLNEAAMLARHGYGALVSALRAHDRSEGEVISFGAHEMKDLAAWMAWLVGRPEVGTGRIGILGNSMGGTLAIRYAASDPRIRAVVANSAFSSIGDTVETSIRFFTGLPPFPFAPMIVFWAEREAGFRGADVDARRRIGELSPRAVFLMQGGTDTVISPESGRLLFEAAGEPKELWFDPELRHTRFDTARPEEYERRVVAFFDKYLGAAVPAPGHTGRDLP